jgi:hypothetical protein
MTAPFDESDEWVEVIQDAIESRVQEIATCLPGKVLSYDAATQTASVRPCLLRNMPTDTGGMATEPLPDMLGVPVAFPRAGDFVLHMPLSPGDFVLLVFPQWSISEFRRIGNQQEQIPTGDTRHHSLGSAIAIPGVFPSGMAVGSLPLTEAIFGNPSGKGVSVGALKVKLGTLAGPFKPTARQGDTVSVTFAPGTVNVSGPGGPSTNAAPIVGSGQITSGSLVVDTSD